MVYFPLCNLQGGLKVNFIFLNSSPLNSLKGARRLARGRRWHTRKKSNFPKVLPRGTTAASTLGWMARVCFCLIRWMKLSSITHQPLCSQDSRPGHQSVECGNGQTCWGLPVRGKPEHGVVFVTLSSAVLETSPSRSKSIPQVSSPMLHHLLRSSTYYAPGTMQPWGSNVEQTRYTQAAWRT